MNYVISSGVTDTFSLTSGDTLQILAGGRSLSSTLDGADAYVQSGGVAQADVIEDGGDEYVSAGGVCISAALNGGGLVVSSGGRASAVYVHSDELTVLAGGFDSGAVLYDPDQYAGAELMDQGEASATLVANGGAEIVDSGGRSFKALVAGGGQIVYAGGLTSGAVVLSGAFLDLYGGGRAEHVTVSSGATAYLPEVILSSGARLVVGSGANTFEGVTVEPGAFLALPEVDVRSGGALVINAESPVFKVGVAAGGRVTGDGVLGGSVLDAGLITDVVISRSGYPVQAVAVESGGEAKNVTVDLGDLDVASSGRTDEVTLASGVARSATETVLSGGTTVRTTVMSGAVETVHNGATAQDTIVSSGGTLSAADAADISGSVISSGGALALSDIVLSSGATLNLFASSQQPTTKIDGATVEQGSIDIASATLLSGAVLSVVSGAAIGGLSVSAGARVIGSGIIDDGGNGYDDGFVSGASLGTSGVLTVGSGGVADQIEQREDSLRIDAGGSVNQDDLVYSNITVAGMASDISLDGSRLYVADGGSVSGVTAEDESNVVISSGGQVRGLVLRAGFDTYPAVDVLSGATVVSTTDSSQYEVIERGGYSIADRILASGTEEVYGSTSETDIGAGGRQDVFGSAFDVFVRSGGEQNAEGRIVSGAICSGGILVFGPSAVASEESVLRGATVDFDGINVSNSIIVKTGTAQAKTTLLGVCISSGANITINDSLVLSGGQIVVGVGDSSSELYTSSGGIIIDNGNVVESEGGTLKGTLSGSGTIVFAATIAGATMQAGDASDFTGTAEIAGNGSLELNNVSDLGSGTIMFLGGNNGGASSFYESLKIDEAAQPASGGTFKNTLENFGYDSDIIYLTELKFMAGASATVKGATLTLHDGDYVENFLLSGTEAASYQVTSDGPSGTMITAVPKDGAALTEAMANFGAQVSGNGAEFKTNEETFTGNIFAYGLGAHTLGKA